MKQVDLAINGGDCVLNSGIRKLNLGITDGIITHLQDEPILEAKETIDASNLQVLPGLIDSQVHLREPGLTHKEDLASGGLAAVLGGITTYFEMPNTNPPCTTMDAINAKVEAGLGRSHANFGFYIGATGENLDDLIEAEGKLGVTGTKIFLGSSTGSLLLYDEVKLLKIFKTLKTPIAVHSESEVMLNENAHIRDNAKSVHAHPVWRSSETAMKSTEMVIKLAKAAQRKIHILHISTKEEIEYLAGEKDYCTVEVTPQHLTLSAPGCYDKLGTYAQMNPPLRTAEHAEALIEGLKKGVVDILGSDHAPHTKEEKDQVYPKSPSGMPGVQTMPAVMLWHVSEGNLTIEELVKMMSYNPAKQFSLKGKGEIKIGNHGDITLVNPNKSMTIKDEDMASKCGWTPFHNMEISQSIDATIVGGTLVMKNGKILSSPVGKPIQREQ